MVASRKGRTLGVILGAGVGSRLRPHTDDRPKILVEIGPGAETVLSRLVVQCADAGMDGIVVVTGFCADAVERYLAATPLALPVQTVFNPDYETMNNAQSLYVARALTEGATIVKFDGDLVLHGDILARLDATSRRSAILLDETKPLVEEDMKAEVDVASGAVARLGKWLPNEVSGEDGRVRGVSIGIERLHADDLPAVMEAIAQMVHVDGLTDRYYEDAYHRVLGAGLDLGYAMLDGLPWIEIDTPAELEIGRRMAAEIPARSGGAR